VNGGYATTPGGLLTATPDGATLAYNTAGQLASRTVTGGPNTSYGYNTRGARTTSTVAAFNQTPAITTNYTYDSRGALASVALPGAVTSYTSDGTSLRQSRTASGTTKPFTWATNFGISRLLDDGTYSYVYGPSATPIAQVNDSTGAVEYLHGDLIGSTRLSTNATGAATGSTVYDTYGKRVAHTGPSDSAIGFSGNWTDPTTGLIYLRARDYDPTTGQFLAVDPASSQTHQPYAYANNNPLQLTDPLGLWTIDEGLDWLAVGLLRGPGSAVASFFEGIGDGATFGVTAQIRNALSPGAECFVNKSGFYFAGYIGGAIAITIVTKGTLTTALAAIGNAGRLFEAGSALTRIAQIGETASGADRAVNSAIASIVERVAPAIKSASASTAKSVDNLLPGLPSSAPKPLGLGSTGRTVPGDLTEQLAMTEVRSAPGGSRIVRIEMTDSRWPAFDWWVKMQQSVNGVNIHYLRNLLTRAVDDFKFVAKS